MLCPLLLMPVEEMSVLKGCQSQATGSGFPLCSYFCDSCEFLWPALFVQVLFASQGLSGRKEPQNSQEEQSDSSRIDHRHHRRSTSRYQTAYENCEPKFFASWANSEGLVVRIQLVLGVP